MNQEPIHIMYSVSSYCQKHCSYCYLKEYRRDYNPENSIPRNYPLVINSLKRLNKPLKLSLLGGELTALDNFNDMMLIAKDINPIFICIGSNGNPDYDWKFLLDLSNKVEIDVFMSVHFEEFDDRIFQVINLLNDHLEINRNFSFSLLVMCHPKYFEKVKWFCDKIEHIKRKRCVYIYEPTMIKKLPYTQEYKDFIFERNKLWGVDKEANLNYNKNKICIQKNLNIFQDGTYSTSVCPQTRFSSVKIYDELPENILKPHIVKCHQPRCCEMNRYNKRI